MKKNHPNSDFAHLHGLEYGLACEIEKADRRYKELTGRTSRVHAMLVKCISPVDVLESLITGASQLDFQGPNARIQFLRYLDENGALDTCCERIVLMDEYASLMPQPLVDLAKSNLAAIEAAR